MKSSRFTILLAARDARASWRRLMLLTAAVMAGVGALVAINSFTDNIRVSLADQAQELLGADLAIRSRQALDTNTAAIALIDSIGALAPGEIRSAASASLPAMAYLQSSGTARLVQLRTVDPGWPFYGQITTEPAGVWPLLQSGGVVVDPSLLGALDAQIGDSLIIGEAPFAIVGTVINVPGEVGLQSAFGARAFIAHNQLASTGLVGFGTRIDHETFLKLPATVDAQDIAEANRESLREHRVRLRTVADDRDNLTDGLTRLGNYLGLVALAALLLGGLGTASAVHVLIRQRLDSIAMLRCLGASSGQVIGAHLLQAVVMGLIGSLAGVALGLMMQQLMPYIFADLLPVDVVVAVSPRAALLGIALGVWTAGIFALLPLLGIRFISPLATLRRNTDPPPARWDLLRGLALVALSASVVGLARVQVGSWREAFWFAVAAAIALVVLWLASLALISLARLFTWSRFPYLVRQGLANLHRPGNQTVTVVLALGFGAFLLTTLFTAQANLLRDFRFDETGERPNLVLVDVQPDQRTVVEEVLAEAGLAAGPSTPLVNMRLLEVKGRSVRDILARANAPAVDTLMEGEGEGGGLWAYRREYRSSYRAELGDAESLVSGQWFSDTTARGRERDDPVQISMELEVARELGVGLGDSLTWNVQGIRIHSVVTSLREVQWARFEPNFFVLFAPGALHDAPQTWVTLVRATDPVVRGQVQRQLAERAANIATVDLGQVQQALEAVIDKVVLAIRFMALFSLATGAIVLVGAVATSRWQRLREGTLLRTLGATRRQVLAILSVEYAALGLAAALVASILASAAGWSLARWVFKSSFEVPLASMAGLAAGLVALTLVVGLWSSWETLQRPPLEVLRSE